MTKLGEIEVQTLGKYLVLGACIVLVVIFAGCTNSESTNPTQQIPTPSVPITPAPVVSVPTPEPTITMTDYSQTNEQPIRMLPEKDTIRFVPVTKGIPSGEGYDELIDAYGCKYYIFPKDLQNVTNASEYSGESYETFNGIPLFESVKFLSSATPSSDTTEYFYNNIYWHKCNNLEAIEINHTSGQPIVDEIPPHPNSAVFSLIFNNETGEFV